MGKPTKPPNIKVRTQGRDAYGAELTSMRPTNAQLENASENLTASARIRQLNRQDKYEGVAEDLERLLTLKRDLCCVPDCNRKHTMWTPKGLFCSKHREEAIEAMKLAKLERYG